MFPVLCTRCGRTLVHPVLLNDRPYGAACADRQREDDADPTAPARRKRDRRLAREFRAAQLTLPLPA